MLCGGDCAASFWRPGNFFSRCCLGCRSRFPLRAPAPFGIASSHYVDPPYPAVTQVPPILNAFSDSNYEGNIISQPSAIAIGSCAMFLTMIFNV